MPISHRFSSTEQTSKSGVYAARQDRAAEQAIDALYATTGADRPKSQKAGRKELEMWAALRVGVAEGPVEGGGRATSMRRVSIQISQKSKEEDAEDHRQLERARKGAQRRAHRAELEAVVVPPDFLPQLGHWYKDEEHVLRRGPGKSSLELLASDDGNDADAYISNPPPTPLPPPSLHYHCLIITGTYAH
jgi:hypothetical protein